MFKTVSLPEVDVEPLGDMMLDFLIERDKEEPFIDFKETLSISKESPFAKIAKDIFAFSNYGGGFIFIGFREKAKTRTPDVEPEKRTYLPVGLPEDFHIDQADLQSKFNSYTDSPIELQYREFYRTYNESSKKFAAIYICPSTKVLKPIKDGIYIDEGRRRVAFNRGAVLIRRGTQSLLATREETGWIEQRAEKTGYRLGILSGQPDRMQETIYANLFEVTKIPEAIWTALPTQTEEEHKRDLRIIPWTVVFRYWNGRIVTFEDISREESPLWDKIDPNTIRIEPLSAWLGDEDKRHVVIEILNKEISFLARRLGLLEEPKKQKFYYECDGDYRTESWSPRFKTSSKITVAQRIYASQLKSYIFWHIAVIGRFRYLGSKLLLRLTPTMQLTSDGRWAVFGPTEGTVITRLLYNRYNSSYLNSLLFWASKLAEGRASISLAQGKIHVFAKPVESKIDVGILSDRPTAEPIQEIPDIELGEEKG